MQTLNWHTNSDTPWDIPTFLLPLNRHTNGDTPWDIPTFLLPLNWHTNNDILWDIPSFLLSLICQPLGTLLGTTLLFYHTSIVTQLVTPIGISQHFRPHRFATNRDVFNYIQLICHRFCKRTIETLFVTPLQYPKQNNSSGLSQFSNQS